MAVALPTLTEQDEKRIIVRAYRNLLKSIKSDIDERDRVNIRTAYEMAVEAHRPQRRKSGEPYILHPIEVARICAAEIGLGPTAVVAALLHDTVEDTDLTLDDIREQFDDKIATIVDGLTKFSNVLDVTSPQAENFKKILRTLTEDVRVVLIKMADRLHNMRTLGAMPKHKQLKIASETTYIYAPLAHRLGLYNIKTEFMDLCLKITEPEAYREIARKLNDTKRARNQYIHEFTRPLESALQELGVPFRILGRPKSIYSIFNKIKTKGVPFEEIYDLFAVRIIVDVPPGKEKSICWQAYSIVTDVHTPIPDRLKDYITVAKANGYESLHATVIGPKGKFVEVQIRSKRMDEIAERGFAAHWKYKGITDRNLDVFDVWLTGIREQLEDPSSDAIEFLNDFKSNLFKEEVYVYTPKGDMMMLPKGATALDFAFAIHSEVGYHCLSIKVNNKLEPLSYKLRNGDQLTVQTSRSQRPTEAWLKMVVTGKARSKIRSAMKEERRKQGEIGREQLERKMQRVGVDFEENVDMLVRHCKLSSRPDLYFAIATEAIDLRQLFKRLTVEDKQLVVPREEVLPHPTKPLIAPEQFAQPHYKGTPRLIIDEQPDTDFAYSLATCCTPVQGDDVFAYNTTNQGVKIHRTTCPNAEQMMAQYGYRIMKARWGTSSTEFVADLLVRGVDEKGVVNEMSHHIANDLGLNMRYFQMAATDNYFEGQLGILVKHKNHLQQVIKSLKSLPYISSVQRIEK